MILQKSVGKKKEQANRHAHAHTQNKTKQKQLYPVTAVLLWELGHRIWNRQDYYFLLCLKNLLIVTGSNSVLVLCVFDMQKRKRTY